MKSLIHLPELPVAEVKHLLSTARRLQGKRDESVLKGAVIGLLFMNPSLRTLASMQTAVAHLGGTSVVVQPGQGTWKLETRDGVVMDGEAAEHVREAIPVLAEYCDILGVRAFADGKDLSVDLRDETITKLDSLCRRPFLSLESAASHPCQALADWKTLDDFEVPTTGRFVLSWAYHPKPLPYAVPRSALTMAARRGMEVVVLCPPGFDLPSQLIQEAEALAKASGGSVRITHDREDAFTGAEAVYVKSWCHPNAYGKPDEEATLRAPYKDWMVDESWFGPAQPHAKFMHCLPVRRNVKVSDALLDGPRSVVIPQAGNRLHVQKAILAHLSESI